MPPFVCVYAFRVKDAAGNFVATGSAQSGTLKDKKSPTFSVSVQGGGTLVRFVFSETVTNAASGALTAANFNVTLFGGAATIGNPSVSGSGQTWTYDLDLQGVADGNEQVIVDVLTGGSAVQDAAGNVVAQVSRRSVCCVVLIDQLNSCPSSHCIQSASTLLLVDLVPTFSVAIASTNVITVTFSEPVAKAAGGTVTKADFSISITGGSATYSAATTAVVADSSDTVFTITLGLVGTADGGESVSVDVVASAIVDSASQAVVSNAQSVTLTEKTAPTFSLALQSDNTIHVTFSEDVTGPAGALAVANLQVSVTSGSTSVSVSPTLQVVTANSAFKVTLGLSAAASGGETATINVQAGAVLDAALNVVASRFVALQACITQHAALVRIPFCGSHTYDLGRFCHSPKTVTLHDRTAPTFAVAAAGATGATVTFSEAVQRMGGAATLTTADFAVSISGGRASLTSFTVTSTSSTVYR